MSGRRTRTIIGIGLCVVLFAFGVVACSDSSSGNGDDGDGNGEVMDASDGGNGGETGPDDPDAESGDTMNPACEHRAETLGVFGPNVFLVIDKSDSMEGQKINQLKAGLDTLADNIADKVRLGASGYPIQSCCCSSRRLLELGRHSAQHMKMQWGDLTAGGGTPTGAALYMVRQGWLEDESDPYGDRRRHAVVLVTDGKPNDQQVCGSLGVPVRSPVEQARKLKNGETTPEAPVYVVGFQSESDGAKLNEIAEAGGTDAPGSERYFVVGNANDLSSALESIAVERTACSQQLDPAPPEGSEIAVNLGGNDLTQGGNNGFTYDAASGTVTLRGDACTQVQNESQDGIALNIEVGCPGCKLAGGSCETADDCCGNASCEDGVCTETCRGIGDECANNGQCCTGTCVFDGNLIGSCAGQ